jgi:hypothetical protein
VLQIGGLKKSKYVIVLWMPGPTYLVWPTESRERPKGTREPSVEDILILDQLKTLASKAFLCFLLRLFLCQSDYPSALVFAGTA